MTFFNGDVAPGADLNAFMLQSVNSPSADTYYLDNLVYKNYFTDLRTLPVKLVSFTATAEAGNVLIKWRTTSEVNNKAFELQHSADGQHFKKIGLFPAKATTAGVDYIFSDFHPAVRSFYWLLQHDLDGRVTVHGIRYVSLPEQKNKAISVYPNPGKTGVFKISKKVKWKVLNIAGISLLDGISNTVDLSHLPRGSYLLQTDNTIIQIVNQ